MKKRIVIFSGAGLSAESDIPTFRDSNGLWESHRIEDVASPEGWQRNPALVLDFYAKRYEKMQTCKPNSAHEAIAKLSLRHEVICITQNIDNLLEQAGVETVWHLHGRIDVQKCEWHKSIPAYYDERFQCDFSGAIKRPIAFGDACPVCGGQLRPDVVWFGEAVDMRQSYLQELVRTTDIFIGVGTSAQVYPAAGLLSIFEKVRDKYFIDPKPAYSVLSDFEVLNGSASEKMPLLVDQLIANGNS
ncbi:Silent information regulator protein Sir2 [Chloroherpeton thalassium ATCC 35110]|uniref:protein acetyllysine N-acetyltransferase n=1 Tax=Chloroherpeton thalassium (strain ATCC 35110 / GB-78) TaxID=517418 RepID=B3QYR0_CHLT3|nr:Sir2 family NAD-dependent protein deacetylase [Chloroherpeton thalassium]ACF15133.1 Silent information regulator protein Sir2 [Chloroherpeton thalassium ATCC 35110]